MAGRDAHRVWAVVMEEGYPDVTYWECQILEPGVSYLGVRVSATSIEEFTLLAPEIEQIVASIQTFSLDGTPAP